MKAVVNDINSKTWFVVAVEEEFKPLNANVLYTGVGKVKAAMAVQWLIDNYKVEQIINVGTAGSVSGIEEIHKGLRRIDFVTERDYSVPSCEKHVIDISNDTNNGLFYYTCCTGDSFVSDWKNYQDTDCADMEAYAIAFVCQQNKIPFECYKFISDSGNVEEWADSLKECNKKLGQYFRLEVES